MKQVEWISRALIELPMCVGFCLSEEAFHKELIRLDIPKKHWPPWVDDDKAGAAHYFEQVKERESCVIVCIDISDKPDDPTAIVGLIIHEAVHVWQSFCLDIGEKNPSREFEAYAIQKLSQRMMMVYSEMTNKKEEEEIDEMPSLQ